MKILLIITGLGVGGAERLVTSYADAFAEKGHEVVLAYLFGEASLLPKDSSVQVVKIGLTANILSLFTVCRKLRSLIKAFQPDVVNSHLFHANIITRILRIFTAMPKLVTSAHNTNENGRFRMLVYRLTDRLADISTNVSVEAVKAFVDKKAVTDSRMLVMHNAIDTHVFTFRDDTRNIVRAEFRIEEGEKVLLSVGHFCEQKDFSNLLHAFSCCKEKFNSLRLVIAGDGPLRQQIESLARSLGIDKSIIFCGIRHDIPAIMSACDVFVLSSAWEGFGLVVAEAMACRRVVVATDCGGVSEVLGSNGYLVPPKSSSALANAINEALLLSKSESRVMGEEAEKRVDTLYSLDNAINKWINLYEGEK